MSEARIDFEIAISILKDVVLEVPPDRSKLIYTAEMLAFRDEVQREVTAIVAAHPGTIIDIPNEIPSLEISDHPGYLYARDVPKHLRRKPAGRVEDSE